MNQEKLLKLADFVDNPELATAKALVDIQEALEQTIPQLSDESKQNTEQILSLVKELASVIPAAKDYAADLQEIKDKLNEDIEVTLNING